MIDRKMLVGAVLLGSCGIPGDVPEDKFGEIGADVMCRRIAECMRGAFEAEYFGSHDCRAHYEQVLGDVVTALSESDCAYDGAAAAQGLETLRDMSCEKFYEDGTVDAFEDVWGDCGVYLPGETTYTGSTF